MKTADLVALFWIGTALGVLSCLIHRAWVTSAHSLLLVFAAAWLALVVYAIKRWRRALRRRRIGFLRPNPPSVTE
ncbi:hypothetical protein ARC78_07475 [Stenotrophomonas pictorum JCM 9942]|uniref:Transmembrane protein n=1 Tax=Stenotrophomonas pictorum JCM 9942 TaxID=1236960 RepID=A0A0R0ANN3_9GAMM|nr:hypothetical protein [Stenotrophomonas pictorum]KRG43198.1 hypothetical protein ARC78_07475 [Stenotrophomonas pictorum JCM 9942]